MLSESFERFYLLLRAAYYRRIAKEVGAGADALSATECFSLEILLLLDKPTLSEFAAFVGVSLPNASYRVNSLIQKGYLEKVIPAHDRRETQLVVTRKYADFYGLGNPEVKSLIENIETAFTGDEVAQLVDMVERIIALMRTPNETGDMND